MRKFHARIVLTENCNAACKHCFNANARHGASMDVDKWLEFVELNKYALGDVKLKVMGGEPTLHPGFEKLVMHSVPRFLATGIFTNGILLPKILKRPFFIRNPKLSWTVNAHTFDPTKWHKYKDDINQISLHNVIPIDGWEKVVEKAINCADMMKSGVKLIISNDTQVDLFDRDTMNKYRKSYMDAMKVLMPEVLRLGVESQPDHRLPVCFFTRDMIEDFYDLGLGNPLRICGCSCVNVGLIGANFDLYHCNQTRIKLGSLLNEDGTFKHVEQIMEMVREAPRTKQRYIEQMSETCRDCPSLPVCRLGCYYNTMVARNS